MGIESINHKVLRRFVETGKPKGLPGDLVDRLFKMINFLIDAETLDELSTPPTYGFHTLNGDRAGTWAQTVTRNWCLTFSIHEPAAIDDMAMERKTGGEGKGGHVSGERGGRGTI